MPSRSPLPPSPPSGAESRAEARADPALKLWVVLSRAFAAIQAHAAADVARHDLTLAEFGILEALFHRGEMLVGELQRRVLVSSGGTTFLVDRLSRRGLVERRPCEEDRRARYVALTPRGERLIREIFPPHAETLRRAMSGLSAAQQREATTLLRALGVQAAERATAQAPDERAARRARPDTEGRGARKAGR